MKKNKKQKKFKNHKGNTLVIQLEPLKQRIGVIFTKVVSNKNLKKHKVKHKSKQYE
jgi:UDP-3-O-acyl-N-acetylglucosamine deacetylase